MDAGERRHFVKTYLWIVLACLVAAVFIFFAAGSVGGVFAGALSGPGTVALILGVVITVVLGVGLMTLVFISHRSGMDDQGRLDQQ